MGEQTFTALKVRLAGIAVVAAVLEVACRTGFISPLTFVAPSQVLAGLVGVLVSKNFLSDAWVTLTGIAIAIVGAVVFGFLGGIALYKFGHLRRGLAPYLATYYSVPTLIFYPMFIVLLGANDLPTIVMGFLHAVVIMATCTLNGLERVPPVMRKLARTFRLDPVRTTFLIVLPAATPSIFTGMKMAVAYAFAGVLGAEFVLSEHGLGYEISYTYNNFETGRMYSLILLVICCVATANYALMAWEKRLQKRRGRR